MRIYTIDDNVDFYTIDDNVETALSEACAVLAARRRRSGMMSIISANDITFTGGGRQVADAQPGCGGYTARGHHSGTITIIRSDRKPVRAAVRTGTSLSTGPAAWTHVFQHVRPRA